MKTTLEIMQRAQAVKKTLASVTSSDKSRALGLMADALLRRMDKILRASERDVENARGKISEVMIDRLRLDEKRIEGMASAMREVALLPDPVGEVISSVSRPNGIVIDKVSSPIGVVAIIYESRPNVTSDAAALALKSGNVCILRGGKEAFGASWEITEAMREGIAEAGLPEDLVQIIEDTSRESANELMRGVGYIDLHSERRCRSYSRLYRKREGSLHSDGNRDLSRIR